MDELIASASNMDKESSQPASPSESGNGSPKMSKALRKRAKNLLDPRDAMQAASEERNV